MPIRSNASGFTLIEAVIALALLVILLSGIAPAKFLLLWTCIGVLGLTWFCAVILIREAIRVLAAGVYPAPGTPKIFRSKTELTGKKAVRHALVAMTLGLAVCFVVPAIVGLLVAPYWPR